MKNTVKRIISSLIALALVLSFATIDAKAQEEVKKYNFGARISFNNRFSRKQYESLEKTSTPFKRLIGGVITITNKETNQVFTFNTDVTGSHQQVPAGKYVMKLVSVPEDVRGRFEWPADKEITVAGKDGQKTEAKPGKKPGKSSPKTGDSGIILTSAIALLAAVALVFTKKEKKIS